MGKWENDIYGRVAQEDWLAIGSQVPTRQSDPIDGLFGDEKTDNLMAKWETISSQYRNPVMAQFHAFDVEAQKAIRVPVDTHNIEKGLIKRKINQSERLRALTRTGVQGDQALYNYVMDDGIQLADAVITRTKVAKNELMATGKVTINENGLNLTVDYGVPASQTGFTLDLTQDADVASQIQAIIDNAADNGVVINGMMTSTKVLTKLRNNKYLQTTINGNIGAGAQLRRSQVEAYFADEFGINTVYVNDLNYNADMTIGSDGRPVVTQAKYYPQNKITFFSTNPGGKLGTGLWGDSPEADAAAFMNVGGSTISPYIYISQWMESDPTELWTKASALFMPVLYNPNSLWIATVADDFLNEATLAPADQASSAWGTPVSSIQSADTAVANGAVTGTLYKQTSGQIVTDWGEGYFVAIKWDDIDPTATSLKVGLEPSAGSGMQEAISDPDKWGVFKLTNKNIQKFKLVSSNALHSRVQTLDLSGLTLA